MHVTVDVQVVEDGDYTKGWRLVFTLNTVGQKSMMLELWRACDPEEGRKENFVTSVGVTLLLSFH